ncbi:unnamed protein product [Parnassius apollo]|uniref:(apollo) hypothetical protein n=1 Tax=Parnassius apollo TaxID=110799 RepID=A0A8S3WNQ5_PARAO|nr:unnamed protein product [Parnassius apollo]
MHNYPPRNSQSLKLNNWMTLNRKVLKKLKLNLCCNTMEQLANNTPGVIERVLLMVRDKIRCDEDANRSMKENEQNLSSGGSYYEACGDDGHHVAINLPDIKFYDIEHVLVVPLKTRVNGVFETVQQKVVSHNSYLTLKEELKDAKEVVDVLKQKVDHLDSLLKLKDERIEELQKQLERKQTRRKEVEALQNSLSVPFDTSLPPSPKEKDEVLILPVKIASTKVLDVSKIPRLEESKIPRLELVKSVSKPIIDMNKGEFVDEPNWRIDKIKIDDCKEIEIIEMKGKNFQDLEEFEDSLGDVGDEIISAESMNNQDVVNNCIENAPEVNNLN